MIPLVVVAFVITLPGLRQVQADFTPGEDEVGPVAVLLDGPDALIQAAFERLTDMARALDGEGPVAFDADVIIYAAATDHPLGARVRPLIERTDVAAIGSVLLLPEVLTKPITYPEDLPEGTSSSE